MAKLIAIVSRAVWLVVVLAAIVHSTQAGGSSKKVKDPRERNDDDWKKLGMACTKTIDRLDYKMDIIKFFSELKVVSKQTDCSEETRKDITVYLRIVRGTQNVYVGTNVHAYGTRGEYAECFELMREYLLLYLDECGYEEKFRKATEIMKEKSHERFSFIQHKTLISYIEERQFFETQGSIRLLGWLLANIENISKLEQMSVETYCTPELDTELIMLFVNNIYIDDVQREFERVTTAFYLDKCGYEKLLSDRIEHMKQVSGRHWDSEKYPTLYSYLAAILSMNKSKYNSTVLIKWLTKTLSMMRELPALESISNETLCVDQPKDTFLADLKFTSSEAPLLYDLYEDYFTLYSNKCGVDKLPNN